MHPKKYFGIYVYQSTFSDAGLHGAEETKQYCHLHAKVQVQHNRMRGNLE